MTESSTQSITIAAEPAAIMAVIADFPAYPEWADAIKQVEITAPGQRGRAERVRFTMDAGLIKDVYELAYTWSDDGLAVTWELLTGQVQKAQHGSYVLRPLAGSAGPMTEVTYSLAVELTIPLLGVLRRKAERTIMDTALRELRARVQAG